MKVFISWSGKRSEAVAKLLRTWIKCVLQATQPWISSQDIGRGAQWLNEINDQLKDTSIGIVCLTRENCESRWIHFEAGALAKGLSANRVCTFLIDIVHSEVKQPLAQFNHTLPEQQSVLQLVEELNRCLEGISLPEAVLMNVFDTYWPQFKDGFDKIMADHPEESPRETRPTDDILNEILESTRSVQARLRRLETADTSPKIASDRKQARIEMVVEKPLEKAIREARKIAKLGGDISEIASPLISLPGVSIPWTMSTAEMLLAEVHGMDS